MLAVFKAARAFMNARMALVAVLSILAAGSAGYWKGGQHMRNSIESDIAREQQLSEEVYQAALKATAENIAGIQIVNRTITQELEREVRYEPVYLDCRHSDDVKRLLDSILTGQEPAESLDRDKLSGADGAD